MSGGLPSREHRQGIKPTAKPYQTPLPWGVCHLKPSLDRMDKCTTQIRSVVTTKADEYPV